MRLEKKQVKRVEIRLTVIQSFLVDEETSLFNKKN